MRVHLFAAAVVSLGLGYSENLIPENGDAWSEARNGLRSRLVTDRAEYRVGERVWLYLDVKNVSGKEVNLAVGEYLQSHFRVIDPKGKVLKATDLTVRGNVGRPLPAGKTTEAELYLVTRIYGTLKPGRYRAFWPSVERAPDESTHRTVGDPFLKFVELPPLKGALTPPSSKEVQFLVLPKARVEGPAAEGRPEIPFGEPVDGLQTRIATDRAVFPLGEPIPARLETRNAEKEARTYYVPQGSTNGWVKVRDSVGKRLSYLGGSAQTGNPEKQILPGKTHLLDSFDLARLYPLGKPGRYSAHHVGEGGWGDGDCAVPPSNTLKFSVIAREGAPPGQDPADLLLGALPERWKLARTHVTCLARPSGNWGRAPGQRFSLRRHLGGRQLVLIGVWLTESKAPQEARSDRLSRWHSGSEYLGETPHGHLYVDCGPGATDHWPAAKADILKALRQEGETARKR